MKTLLVDDEKIIRVTLGDELSAAGHEVVRAGTFAQAAGLLASEEFDCLITDLRLPDGDGLELLKLARRRKGDLIALVITGHGSVESAVQAVKAGAFDYPRSPSSTKRCWSDWSAAWNCGTCAARTSG